MTNYEKNRSERSIKGKLPMNRQRHIVIHDLLLSKCNARNKIWQKTIFVLKLNIFKPLAISLLEKMLSLKSYMKHADNINFRQVQSSNPMSWVHWQYCTLSSQSFTKIYEFSSRRDWKHRRKLHHPWCKDKQLCKGYFPYLFLVNQKLTWRGVYISQ